MKNPIYEIADTDNPVVMRRYNTDGTVEITAQDGEWTKASHTPLGLEGYRIITKREARSLFPNAFPSAKKEKNVIQMTYTPVEYKQAVGRMPVLPEEEKKA